MARSHGSTWAEASEGAAAHWCAASGRCAAATGIVTQGDPKTIDPKSKTLQRQTLKTVERSKTKPKLYKGLNPKILLPLFLKPKSF